MKDYLSLKNFSEIKFSDNDDLEILCIPPWEVERLNVKIDHFHNAASFVEMPQKVVNNYCNYIKKFETKEISLISYDNFNLQDTFNPENLNNFFEKELKILWKKTLIEDDNRQLIYLTSG